MLFNFLKSRPKDPSKELKKILKGYTLPIFPKVVMKTIDLLGDPTSDINEISAIIQNDPGIHIMILQTVNSAAFGLRREVSNINQAITLLGRSRLESIILPLGVKSSIPTINLDCLDMKSFWLTSSRKACIANKIAEKIMPSKKLEAFTAALLQDMAIPIMVNSLGNTYSDFFSNWYQNDFEQKLCDVEQKKLGYSHQDIGGLMAAEWNLPEYLTNAIVSHHNTKKNIIKPCEMVSELEFRTNNEEQNDIEMSYNILKKHLDWDDKNIYELIEVAHKNADDYSKIMY